MTKHDWHEKWREVYNDLPMGRDPKWRFNEAHRIMRKRYGYEPSGWLSIVLKAVFGFAKTGGNVDFSWMKNLWKAVRAGLGLALAAMLYAGFDVLSRQFDTPEELAGLGAPQFLIPLLLAVLVSLRNWLKHKKRVNVP